MTDLDKIGEMFTKNLPHIQALGMELEVIEDGVAEMSMPYQAELVGDPTTKVIHGGAVSALLDSVCGLAVFAHPRCGGATATIGLRIDYMRPAEPARRIFSRAEVYRVTSSVAFVRGWAWDDDPDEPLAMATGTFVFRPKPEEGAQDG